MTDKKTKIVLLCGGVGGAKLVNGFEQLTPEVDSSAVVNVGDDFDHLGLAISPDIDTVLYTLADIGNKQQGWGLHDESWRVMERLDELGGETWFRLGDLDLATHLYRTDARRRGLSLTEITSDLAGKLKLKTCVIPASDQRLRTRVTTESGVLDFQQYFVREGCRPRATAVTFDGAELARPSPALEQTLSDHRVDAVVLAPSNPFLSIDPILAVPGMQDLLKRRARQVLAVCPIIEGRAVKGPAAKMMAELAIPVSVTGWLEYVNGRYPGFVDRWVVDVRDANEAGRLGDRGFAIEVTDTLMTSAHQQKRLAENVLQILESSCR